MELKEEVKVEISIIGKKIVTLRKEDFPEGFTLEQAIEMEERCLRLDCLSVIPELEVWTPQVNVIPPPCRFKEKDLAIISDDLGRHGWDNGKIVEIIEIHVDQFGQREYFVADPDDYEDGRLILDEEISQITFTLGRPPYSTEAEK